MESFSRALGISKIRALVTPFHPLQIRDIAGGNMKIIWDFDEKNGNNSRKSHLQNGGRLRSGLLGLLDCDWSNNLADDIWEWNPSYILRSWIWTRKCSWLLMKFLEQLLLKVRFCPKEWPVQEICRCSLMYSVLPILACNRGEVAHVVQKVFRYGLTGLQFILLFW